MHRECNSTTHIRNTNDISQLSLFLFALAKFMSFHGTDSLLWYRQTLLEIHVDRYLTDDNRCSFYFGFSFDSARMNGGMDMIPTLVYFRQTIGFKMDLNVKKTCLNPTGKCKLFWNTASRRVPSVKCLSVQI